MDGAGGEAPGTRAPGLMVPAWPAPGEVGPAPAPARLQTGSQTCWEGPEFTGVPPGFGCTLGCERPHLEGGAAVGVVPGNCFMRLPGPSRASTFRPPGRASRCALVAAPGGRKCPGLSHADAGGALCSGDASEWLSNKAPAGGTQAGYRCPRTTPPQQSQGREITIPSSSKKEPHCPGMTRGRVTVAWKPGLLSSHLGPCWPRTVTGSARPRPLAPHPPASPPNTSLSGCSLHGSPHRDRQLRGQGRPAVPAAVSVGCRALSRHLLGVGEGMRGSVAGRESRALQPGGCRRIPEVPNLWASAPLWKGGDTHLGAGCEGGCGVQHLRGTGQPPSVDGHCCMVDAVLKSSVILPMGSVPKKVELLRKSEDSCRHRNLGRLWGYPSPWGCPDQRCYLGTCGLVLGAGVEVSSPPRPAPPPPITLVRGRHTCPPGTSSSSMTSKPSAHIKATERRCKGTWGRGGAGGGSGGCRNLHKAPNAQRYSPRKQGLFQKIPGRVLSRLSHHERKYRGPHT